MTHCSAARSWCGVLAALLACLPRPSESFFAMSPGLSKPVTVRRITAQATCRPSGPGRLAAVEVEREEIPAHLDRSAPPVFIENNNVSFDKDFVVRREGEPTAEELSNENLLQIVAQSCTDEEVNFLLWKCLGYRYDPASDKWCSDAVFPGWKKNYPEPPDLIGVTRVYEREVDQSVMKAVQAIVRAVPQQHKMSIKEHLRGVGFTGYMVSELTPNRTRRAQAVNFMLYFRENLWGVSLEELQRRKKEKKEQEARRPLIPEETADSQPA